MSIKTWRQKGKKGEYEVLDMLQPIVDKVYDEMKLPRVELRRNTNQSGFNRDSTTVEVSGFDVAGLDWLSLEIKRQEKLYVTGAWMQCKEAAASKWKGIVLRKPDGMEGAGEMIYERVPVLIWRMNREAWKVRMFGYLTCDGGLKFDEGCGGRIRCPVDIGIEAFLAWFEMKLRFEIRSSAKLESDVKGVKVTDNEMPDRNGGLPPDLEALSAVPIKSGPVHDPFQRGLFDD